MEFEKKQVEETVGQNWSSYRHGHGHGHENERAPKRDSNQHSSLARARSICSPNRATTSKASSLTPMPDAGDTSPTTVPSSPESNMHSFQQTIPSVLLERENLWPSHPISPRENPSCTTAATASYICETCGKEFSIPSLLKYLSLIAIVSDAYKE